jgi:[pyruvate, water dikinase]-phosphate phosphotransferase / [pyruvate, water dikinase] kinase
MLKRSVYFVSDGTGITAASLGQSLLTQFERIQFHKITLPYINDHNKAMNVITRINRDFNETSIKPIVFTTLIESEIAVLFKQCQGLVINLFQTFIGQLEQEFGIPSSHSIGKTHGMHDLQLYNHRIDAINYTMTTDDGANPHYYDQAEVILIGVSRCGKTPTSLYLALQFGTYAANYPFTEDQLPNFYLPDYLWQHKNKLYGLLIEPKQLHEIRQQRRPDSHYADLKTCEAEINAIKTLYLRENIPFINTTARSIEEIATFILNEMGLESKFI